MTGIAHTRPALTDWLKPNIRICQQGLRVRSFTALALYENEKSFDIDVDLVANVLLACSFSIRLMTVKNLFVKFRCFVKIA